MEVILKKNVDGLGEIDDLVAVKDGYGRNYLIPQGLAALATPASKKVREENLRQRAHKIAKMKEQAEETAKKLEAASITVGAKAGENGKIFGSVSNLQLADAIEKMGYSIERKNIKIVNDPIKEVGKYQAVIKLHKEVESTINFEVVGE